MFTIGTSLSSGQTRVADPDVAGSSVVVMIKKQLNNQKVQLGKLESAISKLLRLVEAKSTEEGGKIKKKNKRRKTKAEAEVIAKANGEHEDADQDERKSTTTTATTNDSNDDDEEVNFGQHESKRKTTTTKTKTKNDSNADEEEAKAEFSNDVFFLVYSWYYEGFCSCICKCGVAGFVEFPLRNKAPFH